MDGFTAAQAAVMTGLSLAAVRKAIDTRLVRPKVSRRGTSVRRLLSKEQLVYLRLEAAGLRLLPVGTRRTIAESMRRSPGAERLVVPDGAALLVEIGSARQEVEGQVARMARLRELIVEDPEIQGGAPVFRGTRIPVAAVAAMLEQGTSAGEILAGYPSLSLECLEAAPVYQRAFPRRGRPGSSLGDGMAVRERRSFPLPVPAGGA